VLNLTAAATLLNDHNFFFYVRSGSIQINPNGAELINGVADIVFTAGAWGWVFCDGTGFTVMSNANLPAEVIFTSNIADESVTYAKLSPALATDLPTVTIVAEDNLFILDASDANLPKKGLASDIAVPAGAIVDFARTTAPSGYLALPVSPSNVSRTTYARLFAAIGITWGAGDGSTTFGLPYCPENYAMLAANGNVGAVTTGDVKAHTHTAQGQVAGALYGQDTGYQIGAVNTGSTGGAANLAAGVKVLKCIKL
jgi:microcystin-dependent protein